MTEGTKKPVLKRTEKKAPVEKADANETVKVFCVTLMLREPDLQVIMPFLARMGIKASIADAQELIKLGLEPDK